MKTAVKINGQNVNVPADWSEVTYGLMKNVRGVTDNYMLISFLTGIELEAVKTIPEETINIMLHPCSLWLDEPMPEITKHSLPIPSDIQEKEFARRVNAEHMLKEADEFLACGIILSIYLAASIEDEAIEAQAIEVDKMPVLEVIAAGRELLEQYKKLCQDESKAPKPQRRSEEERAGIGELDKFGVFAFVDGLAGGDILKHDLIYSQPYRVVMLKAHMNTEYANYHRRLAEIMKPKGKEK